MRLRDLGFRGRFLLLGVIFVLGYAIALTVAAFTVNRVRVNGPIYEQVVLDKDLVADVLPPPKNLLQSYLVAYEIATAQTEEAREARITEFHDAQAEYARRHAHWKREIPAGELHELLLVESHVHAEAFFKAVEKELIPAARRDSPDLPPALEVVLNRLDPLYVQHRGAIVRAVRLAGDRVAEHEADAAAAVRTGSVLALGVALGFAVLVGLLGWLVARSVVSPAGLVVGRMREMAEAEANLSARLAVDSQDELGQLARWFNAFLEKIAGLVRATKKSAVQLTSTVTQMAATSRQQEATVQGFGASTNEIAAAVKEISATSAELTRTMGEIGEVAQDSAKIATQGRASLGEMEAAMNVLAASSASISSKLGVISEKASDITGVVTTITKVADQTNLLSVNAAIEAEKAGEYGRGFLVVSREIRRLADQTAAATLDIEETVQQMQTAVSAGVMEMDKFTDQVRRSVDEVRLVSGNLAQIIERVETLTSRFGTVQDGMTSQSHGAQQINDAMGSLNESVRRTVGSLAEFTSAAEDLGKAVGGLRAELGKFRLES